MLRDFTQRIKLFSEFWNLPFGNAATASFIICVVSGIFLALPYDIQKPYDSISLMLLINPYGVFFRNIHYWSAQLFLIFTIIHTIDHLRRKNESRQKNGVWFRLTLSLFFIFYVMLSGFILKADADSQQALRIFNSLLNEIPFIGKGIAFTLLGSEGDYQIIYINHIATATIILTVIIIEHSKILWPKISVFIYTIIISALLGYIFSPMLHDGLHPVVKGPWYFVGLQEILHWITHTQLIIVFSLLLFIPFYFLKRFPDNISSAIKKFFVFLGFAYLILTVIAYYFRGENWEFVLPWDNTYKFVSDFQPFASIPDIKPDEISSDKIKSVLGRKEGCIVCHQMEGMEASHNPESIGCYSCHRGNAFTLNKSSAHSGMILIPGNLDDAHLTCGTSQCHPDIIPRVKNSIMTTLSGIVSVNRFVFDESNSPTLLNHIRNIKHSNADTHLRNLCASCHLGNPKTELGSINELSRGGGCNACHLNYSNKASEQLNEYKKSIVKSASGGQKSKEIKILLPKIHPQLNLNISDDHCFGCHSRSGRISTNFQGWSETLSNWNEVIENKKYRLLLDERVFKKEDEDVHHKAGMGCIDCHISQEVMGDGNLYPHKENQLKVQCIDCHSNNLKTLSYDELDYESRKIVEILKSGDRKTKFISTNNSSLASVNSYIDANNKSFLVTKSKKDTLQLKPPALICTEGNSHKRLSCNSCHTKWISYCVGCHTQYDPNSDGYDLLDNKDTKGSWVESSSDFYVDYPALGVRKNESGTETIETFIPGMIINIDKMRNNHSKKIFKRLFASVSAHTTSKEGRSCKSCHNNSLAIGYGKGKLYYSMNGKWSFIPEFKISAEDNLPKDAWIGFLQTRNQTSTTRNNTRPFTVDEQKKILTVGACLTCHDEDSKVMRNSLNDFKKVISSVSGKCILPDFNR